MLIGFIPAEGDGIRILSLDGGDARSMSQLIILEELMHRLKNDLNRPVRPCEYFHLITGVGAAGLIAILLGVLGLTVTEARDAFATICQSVLHSDESIDILRSEKLEEGVKELLMRLQIPEGARLQGELDLSAGCHVSICYASAVNMGTCRMFRSYTSAHSSHNPTIVEAVRSSWATPGLFSSIRLGEELVREEIVSAVNGFNNPTLEVIKEAKDVFGANRRISCLLSLGAGQQPIRSASSTDYMKRTAEDTEMIAREANRRLGRLGFYHRFSVEHGVDLEGAIGEGTFGVIAAHTAVYLEGDNIARRLDRFLTVSGSTSNATLESISRAHNRFGTRVSHNLPPLSAFLVAREEPMNALITALKRNQGCGQRRAVVTGLSGCGKTQISLKYAYDHDDEYDHILFIDASSSESIQEGIVTRVRVLDWRLHPKTPKEALNLLAYPEGNISKNWLIIMDNADNSKFDIRDFFPPATDHGAILITSRNAALGNLSSVGHIPLDVMSLDEAVEALLSAALGPVTSRTTKDTNLNAAPIASWSEIDRQAAVDIVKTLGFLPIAIIQAACYIKMQKCLHNYLPRLIKSRGKLLRWPASVQSDRLKYAHSTYAAFDNTISVLSARTLQTLGILSFFHFTNFPRLLVTLGASSGFAYDAFDLLDRTPEYHESIALLKAAFCPGGDWDEIEFDEVLEELQQYSLVTLVPVYSVITLRFHPLLHAWSRDRLLEEEQSSLGAAAARLLVCGADPDEHHLWQYLSPHVNLLSLTSEDLHVNDRAALASILRGQGGHVDAILKIWQGIHAAVEKAHGTAHIRTIRAGLHLADAYGMQGDAGRMETMERDLLEVSRAILGHDHLETAKVMSNLARSCKARSDGLSEAATLEENALLIYRDCFGPQHRDIVDALHDLAATRVAQEDYVEARRLLEEALSMITSLVGRLHVVTIYVMESLADCHASAGNTAQSVELQREGMNLWRVFRGDRHAATLNAMAGLASTYQRQAQYAHAEKVWREVVEGRQEMLGQAHEDYLSALSGLARSIYDQSRYSSAEELWVDELVGRRALHGHDHEATLEAAHWTARAIFEQQRYAEAEDLWREELEGRRKLHGEHHRETQSTLYWLARAVQAQDRFDDAAVLWREHVMARRKMGDISEILSGWGWLATSLREMKQYAESEEIRKEELKGRRELHGLMHNDTLNTLFSLARLLFEVGRYAEAETLWKEELKARRELNGEYHTDTMDAIHWLGQAIQAQERYAESEALWRELLAAQRKMNIVADSLSTLGWLAIALREQERYPEAESIRREELDGRCESLGRLDITTMNSLFSLSRVVFDQGRYEEAEEMWKQELQCRREVHGDRHSDAMDAIHWLGRSLYEQGKYAEAKVLWEEEAEGRPEVDGKDNRDTIRAAEWLEKVTAKLNETLEVSGPSVASEESGNSAKPSSTDQLQGESLPTPSSHRIPQRPRGPSPWLQRFQESSRRRLDRISHAFP